MDAPGEDASEKKGTDTFRIHLGGEKKISAMRSGRRRIIPAVNQYTKLILNKLGSAPSNNVQHWIVLARKEAKSRQGPIC